MSMSQERPCAYRELVKRYVATTDLQTSCYKVITSRCVPWTLCFKYVTFMRFRFLLQLACHRATADATNGYMRNFSVYTGAIAGRERALGEKIVLTLSESIMGRPHPLFFDNYFTSVKLLSTLLDKGTYVRLVPFVPTETSTQLKLVKRQRSSCGVFRQCRNLVATAWKDKVVNIAWTLADPVVHDCQPMIKGQYTAVQCPLCVVLYNKVHRWSRPQRPPKRLIPSASQKQRITNS